MNDMISGTSSDTFRIEITDVEAIKVLGQLRWTGKAKFPKSLRARTIVIFQFGEEFVAIASQCPHEQANLAEGRFVSPFVLECPLHQNHYDLRTGAIKSFKVVMEDERLYLLWQRSSNEPVPPTFSGVTDVGVRPEDERCQTLEREIAALNEAAAMRQRQIMVTLQQMEGMISEVETKRTAIEEASTKMAAINEFVGRVMDTMSEGLLVFDNQRRLTEVNLKFTTVFGASREELLRRPMDDFFSGEAFVALTAVAKGLLPAGSAHSEFEAPIVTKSGDAIEHLLRIAPLFGGSGKKEGIVVVCTDIRRIKAAQREVTSAYGKVSNLLNSMRQGVFVVLASGVIVEPVSRFTAEIFGRDVAGANIFDVLFRDLDRSSVVFMLLETAYLTVFGSEEFQWDLMEEHLPRRVTLGRFDNADACSVLRVEYCPLRDANGVMDQLMIIVDDVTKVELLEQERQSQERRTHILEELASSAPDTLREFFPSAYQQIATARRLCDDTSVAGKQTFFRTLHTLKGNARMNRLTLVGQATHETETAATFLNDPDFDSELVDAARAKLRTELVAIQSQLAEYSDVAERILHIPNDYEGKATLALHEAAFTLDLELERQFAADATLTPFRRAAFGAPLGAFLDAADDVGSARVRTAGLAFERALDCLPDGQPATASGANEVRVTAAALTCAVVERLCDSRSFSLFSLSVTNWSLLYRAVFGLTQRAVGEGAETPSGVLDCQRAIEEAVSAASTLKSDYLLELLGRISREFGRVAHGPSRPAIQLELADIWSFLGLHSTLEGLATLRHGERVLLHNALASPEASDTALARLERDGRVRIGTLTAFLDAVRQEGVRTQQVFEVIGELYAETRHTRIAEMFCSSFPALDLKDALAAFDANLTHAAANSWYARLGGGGSMFGRARTHGPSYLNRYDVVRLGRTLRDFVRGEFQLLFDKVHSVEIQSARLTELHRALAATKAGGPSAGLADLERAIDELSYVAVLPSFYRYYAMVSDIAARLLKRVELRVSGDSAVGMPRDALSKVQDCLVHLLRNALDHGIELPVDRTAGGKPETGTVTLHCARRDGKVLISLRDDGRGINAERLRGRAVELGFLSDVEAAALTQEQAIDLIFMPRLTTAGDVTDLSGRGIGMDIVRENLSEIGAGLTVQTEVGHGTVFTISVSLKTSTSGP